MAVYRDPREGNKQHKQYPFSSHCASGKELWIHYHEMIELLFFVEGESEVFVGNNSYKTNPGDLVIINSGEIHSLYSEKGTSYIVVQIDPEFLYTSDKTTSNIKYVYPFLHSNPGNPRIFKKDEICRFNIEELTKSILKQCTDMDFGFELSVKGDIYKLFFYILKYLEQQGKITDISMYFEQDTSNAFYRVFEFVKNNYSSNITAKDAAKVANLSYSYFSRLFNSVMNTGFKEYLNSVRIVKSEQMLLDSDAPITDIAMACGFSTTSYFITNFKKKYGISPLGFRKKFSEF